MPANAAAKAANDPMTRARRTKLLPTELSLPRRGDGGATISLLWGAAQPNRVALIAYLAALVTGAAGLAVYAVLAWMDRPVVGSTDARRARCRCRTHDRSRSRGRRGFHIASGCDFCRGRSRADRSNRGGGSVHSDSPGSNHAMGCVHVRTRCDRRVDWRSCARCREHVDPERLRSNRPCEHRGCSHGSRGRCVARMGLP